MLIVLTADGSAPPRRLDELDTGRVVDLEVAPTADQVAVGNHRNELLLVDLDGRAARRPSSWTPARSAGSTRLAWSPDGRWLAYHAPITAQTTRDQALPRGSTPRDRPRSPSRSCATTLPAWDPEGNYLYFIGQRDFNPVYDELQFDLSFPMGARPFAIALRKDVPSPFLPAPEGARRARRRRRRRRPRPSGSRPPRRRSRSTSTASSGGPSRFPVPEGKYGRDPGDQGQGAVLVVPGRGDAHAITGTTPRRRPRARWTSTTSRPRSRTAWSRASPTSGSAATARRCSTGPAIACGCSRPARSRRPTPATTPEPRRAAGSTWSG